MEKKYLYKLFIVSLCLFLGACEGYLNEIPQNKQKLSTTDDYDQLLNNAYLTKAVLPYIDVLTDDVDYMAADRQPNFANSADTYLGAHLWDNSIETTMPNGDETFEKFYNSIFNTNVIIGNIDNAIGDVLDEAIVRQTRDHIKGEAYALRAFRYFYLVNMYAAPYDPATCEKEPGIPINLEMTAEDKAYHRSSLKVVYEQIVDDLEKAIPLLENNPMDTDKTRFSALAAKALLAKVYLYMQEWDLAIEQAEKVIKANPALFDLRDAGENPVIYTETPLSYWSPEDVPGIGYLDEENDNVLFVNGINELYMILSGDIAETVLERATCLRRIYGAIIVKNDEIISTGYNGAPRGRRNCVDMGYCTRERLQVPRGERYELCRSVHAEANAIISASRRDMVGGTIYLVGRNAATGELLNDATSCLMCRRMVINAGLERVVIRRTETEFEVVPVEAWIAEDDLLTPENVVMDLK